MKEVSEIKKDFPIFQRLINGKELTYLDSGATSQKPNIVIDSMSEVYKQNNANVHRGTYVLSSETTSKYEDVRNKFKNFINANSPEEIIFTKGCTEGFNLLANSLCKDLLNTFKSFLEPSNFFLFFASLNSDFVQIL